MTYWVINAWFLGVVLVIALVAWTGGIRPRLAGIGGSLVVVGLLTALFDNAIIGFGLVDYDPEHISGVKLGFAPVEDFAYTLAGAVLIPVIFEALGRWTKRES